MTRILVVDDNNDIAFMIREKLRHFVGGEISTAKDGECALELILENPPDLVILDICMPVVDGYEVCRKLKADRRTAAVPVIFITSTYNDLRSRIKGLDLGADDYIVQPVDDLELVTRVKAVLRIKKMRDQLEQAQGAMSVLQERHQEIRSRVSECCHTMLEQCRETPAGAILTATVTDQARTLLRWFEETSRSGQAGELADQGIAAIFCDQTEEE